MKVNSFYYKNMYIEFIIEHAKFTFVNRACHICMKGQLKSRIQSLNHQFTWALRFFQSQEQLEHWMTPPLSSYFSNLLFQKNHPLALCSSCFVLNLKNCLGQELCLLEKLKTVIETNSDFLIHIIDCNTAYHTSDILKGLLRKNERGYKLKANHFSS